MSHQLSSAVHPKPLQSSKNYLHPPPPRSEIVKPRAQHVAAPAITHNTSSPSPPSLPRVIAGARHTIGALALSRAQCHRERELLRFSRARLFYNAVLISSCILCRRQPESWVSQCASASVAVLKLRVGHSKLKCRRGGNKEELRRG